MDAVKAGNTVAYTNSAMKSQTPLEKPDKAELLNSVAKVESNKVTLSDEGKALLAALQEIDDAEKESKAGKNESKTIGDKVESFTYGALGMDSPDEIKEEKDESHSAGQYFSGLATAGAILLALV